MDAVERGRIATRGLTLVSRSGRMEVVALRHVDVSVEPGEFVAVMGPSGCGKSTLLHLLGGLVQPTAGEIYVDGIDIARLSDPERTAVRRRKVGFIFQRFNLLPNISARANIDLAKRIHRNGHVNLYGDDDLLALLGIKEKIGLRPTELSGGEQQRVAIARALINSPRILFADEPCANLDTISSERIMETLVNLNKELGVTVVFVSHDPDDKKYANKFIYLKDGKQVAEYI